MIARVGSYESQEHENHMVLEKPEFFKLQTNQRGSGAETRGGEEEEEWCEFPTEPHAQPVGAEVAPPFHPPTRSNLDNMQLA